MLADRTSVEFKKRKDPRHFPYKMKHYVLVSLNHVFRKTQSLISFEIVP